MNLKEIEITCPHCGASYPPRVPNPKRCAKCGKSLPKQKLKFIPKSKLREYWLIHFLAGSLTLFVGSIMTLLFVNVIGAILGSIGMLFFLVLGQRYYVEFAIYDLLHKPAGE